MATTITTNSSRRAFLHSSPWTSVTPALSRLLPQSLALLRRLQHQYHSSHALVAASFPPTPAGQDVAFPTGCFACAYVDRSVSPETEMYVFVSGQSEKSTCNCKALEGFAACTALDAEIWKASQPAPSPSPCAKALLDVLRLLAAQPLPAHIAARTTTTTANPNPDLGDNPGTSLYSVDPRSQIKIGAGHPFPIAMLHARTILDTAYRGMHIPYVEHLLRARRIPELPLPALLPAPLPEDKATATKANQHQHQHQQPEGEPWHPRWTTLRGAELDVVIARTHIPRQRATLAAMQCVAVALSPAKNGHEAETETESSSSGGVRPVAIAWAFVNLDGALASLHVEPQYRGRGLAKVVAARSVKVAGEAVARCSMAVSSASAGLRTGGAYDGEEDGDVDDWVQAEVAIGNRPSEAVFERLGAQKAWVARWVLIDVAKLNLEN